MPFRRCYFWCFFGVGMFINFILKGIFRIRRLLNFACLFSLMSNDITLLFALKRCFNHLSNSLQYFQYFFRLKEGASIPLVLCNIQEPHLVQFYNYINEGRVGRLTCTKYHTFVTSLPTRTSFTSHISKESCF